MKITETQLRNMITESVKKVLSEVSWQKGLDAASAAEDSFSNFESILSKMEEVLIEFDECFDSFNSGAYPGGKMQRNDGLMKYFKETETIRGFQYKAKQLYDEMEAYYNRKKSQVSNLSNMADEKFKEAHNGKDYDTVWNEYINSNEEELTPEHQEIADYEYGDWKNNR